MGLEAPRETTQPIRARGSIDHSHLVGAARSAPARQRRAGGGPGGARASDSGLHPRPGSAGCARRRRQARRVSVRRAAQPRRRSARRGSRLIVRRGAPLAELAQLVEETGATAIYAEADPWPYARARDARGRGAAAAAAHHRHHRAAARPGGQGRPIALHRLHPLTAGPGGRCRCPRLGDLRPAPERLPAPPGDLVSLPIPDQPALPGGVPFPPGEAEALRRLAAFTASGGPAPVHRYADGRNRMDLAGTSELSPYLRFGMVSAKRAAVAALDAAAGRRPMRRPAGAPRPGSTS